MKTGRRRRGYTLVFFAMMLFGIMAMAALVIDIGFARLTQRQMQTAVDAAALEGLRFRDDYPPGYSAPTSLEDARRQQASDIVVWMFDDDFEPSNGDPFHFGAGPRIELGPGIDDSGKINASQFISSPENPNRNPKIGSLPNPPVYKPSGLEPNAGDVVHGDMVAGIYNQDGVHGEDSNYNRGDFTPKPAITDPHAPDDESFLVRMRRLHNDFDVVDTEEDISSKGSEIPFLFGRGAMLPIENPDGEYLPRIHGIAVRATAIADARPVRSVGAAHLSTNPNITDAPGAISIAIRASQWMQMSGVHALNVNATDRSQIDDSTLGNVGFVTNANADSTATSVGLQPASLAASPDFADKLISSAALVNGLRRGYLIIVGDTSLEPVDYVVGFGLVDAMVRTGPDGFEITKHTGHIASENASTTPTEPIPQGLAADTIRAGFALGQHALLAPSLAR